MARWTASAKWAAGPALDGQRDMPLALRLSEGLGLARQGIRDFGFVDSDVTLCLKTLQKRNEFFLGQLLLEQRVDRTRQCLQRSRLRGAALLEITQNDIDFLWRRLGVRYLQQWNVGDVLRARGEDLPFLQMLYERIEACVLGDDVKERCGVLSG